YDKDLPEIPDRQAHLPPTSYLRKKAGTADEFEIVEGRRPSQMLLVNRLRKAVDKWRNDGYPGASSVTQRLFTYWFDEDQLQNGDGLWQDNRHGHGRSLVILPQAHGERFRSLHEFPGHCSERHRVPAIRERFRQQRDLQPSPPDPARMEVAVEHESNSARREH